MICRYCRRVIVKGRPLIAVPELWILAEWPIGIHCGERLHHEPLTLEVALGEIAALL